MIPVHIFVHVCRSWSFMMSTCIGSILSTLSLETWRTAYLISANCRRCVCEEGYVGDQCEIQWSAGGFDVFDGVPEYFVDAAATTGAMVGTEADPFPSLRQALDNTPKSSARVFKFKPGTYSGPANILGARETLAMEAPLALVSAGACAAPNERPWNWFRIRACSRTTKHTRSATPSSCKQTRYVFSR